MLMFKTQADKKIWAQPDAYESLRDIPIVMINATHLICSWQKGHATGDENVATENLRRFFEQRFHENNDSCDHSRLGVIDLMPDLQRHSTTCTS
jgi:hypothetical protein